MTIDSPPDYEDVNQAAIEDWKAETTTRERIRAVVQRIQEPTSAAAIAKQAYASEPVVRDALADLVDLGVIETLETTQGTLYKRNDQMYIYRQVVELHEAYDEDELVTELQALKQTVNA